MSCPCGRDHPVTLASVKKPRTYTAKEMQEAFIAGVEWPTATMKYTAEDYVVEAKRLYPDEA